MGSRPIQPGLRTTNACIDSMALSVKRSDVLWVATQDPLLSLFFNCSSILVPKAELIRQSYLTLLRQFISNALQLFNTSWYIMVVISICDCLEKLFMNGFIDEYGSFRDRLGEGPNASATPAHWLMPVRTHRPDYIQALINIFICRNNTVTSMPCFFHI